MQFRIEVTLPPQALALTPQSRVMAVGSCFAEHIGGRLAECLPDGHVRLNPRGVMYNPISTLCSLTDLTNRDYEFRDAFSFLAGDGLWHNWHYSTRFTAPTRDALSAMMQKEWEQSKAHFDRLDALLVTFSTDHAYFLHEEPLNGVLAANCHKQPARMFDEQILDLGGNSEMWGNFLHELEQTHPSLRVVFTLSPYRYVKYGLHENALCKARLLLLIESICAQCGNAAYFPAYEIVNDELRDYRFYGADMLHPTEQAVDYVWERFQSWAFTPQLRDYARDRQALLRDLAHRPLHPDSEESRRFAEKREERRRLFEKKWGGRS